jgi:hypothetical protein
MDGDVVEVAGEAEGRIGLVDRLGSHGAMILLVLLLVNVIGYHIFHIPRETVPGCARFPVECSGIHNL